LLTWLTEEVKPQNVVTTVLDLPSHVVVIAAIGAAEHNDRSRVCVTMSGIVKAT